MAANPFLFTEDDYVSPHSATSNPFLINDDLQAENDNPFLAQNAPTNPFAFDPEELEDTNTNDQNFFCATIPQKPTDLDLKYTNTVETSIPGDVEPQKTAPMPPPRPPPSKETQDLLMSVMGAMDATSSHLLDRIPPTRTPSPVSMRDLHSPSPTPEPNLGDLLDVGDAKPPNTQEPNDLLSLCDINQNPPLVEAKQKPARPSPPSRPPRPPPPPQPVQKPPKPPPPAATKPKSPADEMMDMFGSEAPTQTKTKDDILNLYNKPRTEPTVKDLLFDDAIEEEKTPQVDSDVAMEDAFESVTKVAEPVVTQIIEQSIEKLAETVVALSPEPPNDMQMDTSDSQSKDSISSTTFNPFTSSEETVIQKSPVDTIDNNVFQEQPIILDNAPFQPTETHHQVTITKTPFTPADSFDAFAEKFESAKEGETNGGIEAFANGNDDAWGSGNSGIAGFDSSSGFEAEGSFDAFLAMQEPPAVPQSTPNRLDKAGSESDEDKDFSVFIK